MPRSEGKTIKKPEKIIRDAYQYTLNARVPFQQRIRQRIDSAMITERLCRCAMGEIEMTTAELTAAKMLLDRTVPVLKPLDPTPEGDMSAKTITNADLFRIIDGSAERVNK
jgi:hypothetical protein